MPQKGFDFFLLDRSVCDIITSVQENNVYLMGLISWLGFSPKVLYYHRRKREKRYGRSMWTFARKIKYFIDSFVAFSYFPVRAATVTGLILSAIGLIYAAILIVLRVFSEIPVEGWTSMMVTLLFVSGVQLLVIGILGEYIWRTLDETRKRPRFIIDKVVEANSGRGNPPKTSS
jgi:dolichol-phosphate mannosyltransferase